MRGAILPCLLVRLLGGIVIAAGTSGLRAAVNSAPTSPLPVTVAESTGYQIVISVSDQSLTLFREHQLLANYRISTSKFGLGDEFGSFKTPLGLFRVREKIGGELSAGAVLKDRAPTGETVRPDAPGRDPIVSRIFCLEGLEAGNRNALDRGIYIHGTVEESRLGQPVSWGCIRMSSHDVISLYRAVPVGTLVSITIAPLRFVIAEQYRQSFTLVVPRPLALDSSAPVVAANFADITYTALLEFRLARSEFSFGLTNRASLLDARDESEPSGGNSSTKQPTPNYAHH